MGDPPLRRAAVSAHYKRARPQGNSTDGYSERLYRAIPDLPTPIRNIKGGTLGYARAGAPPKIGRASSRRPIEKAVRIPILSRTYLPNLPTKSLPIQGVGRHEWGIFRYLLFLSYSGATGGESYGLDNRPTALELAMVEKYDAIALSGIPLGWRLVVPNGSTLLRIWP